MAMGGRAIMKFLEAKAKEIFSRYGIPIPRGVLASNPGAIVDPPLPCMVKAQVLIGGRGKAGGIRPATSLEEARTVAGQILGMNIGGYTVQQVYLEERLDIEKELYLSYTIDRSAREALLMSTSMGGMEVETLPREEIFMEHVPVLVGPQPYLWRAMLKQLGVRKEIGDQIVDIARKTYTLFRNEDAELVEINPLVVARDGRVIAGDAKLVIDDNAEYRHPEYVNLNQDRTPLEQEAHDKGITFIQLDGDIGVIANGAGLTMATLDILNLKGGRGGTFLDLGGTDDPTKVEQAFELLIKANPTVILLNIFGGITKADTVALGVKQALERMPTKIPVVARIKGVNETQAKEMLRSIGMFPAETVEEAAELAVKVRPGGG
jgi:succinyl-CoA synthetase beta subunit